MSSVIRDPLIEMVTARWDCGPGCGTTGCGNDPESIRRYEAYRRGESIERRPRIGEPGWTPQSMFEDQPKRGGWLHRLLVWLAERTS